MSGLAMLTALILALHLMIDNVHAWGFIGHQVVGLIAKSYLSREVSDWAQELLPEFNGDMGKAAVWADEARGSSEYHWSGSLHYADAEAWSCKFVHSRDCPTDWCVTGAIANYSKRLSTMSGDEFSQNEALKFLIHLVGDIHQPLHVGFRSDLGGNSIHGVFMQHSSNLHAVWDDHIINYRVKSSFHDSQGQFLEHLLERADSELAQDVSNWMSYEEKDELKWASESAAAACKYAYSDEMGNKIKDPFNLGEKYYEFALEEIEIRLITAGVRLAALLTRAFDHSTRLAVQ